jgi:hypothetical protein
MSHPTWPVVTENLAEQLSAAQGGIVHPAQLLPYLPLSLELIEQTLDELASSDRVEKQQTDGLTVYIFKESLNKTPHHFDPRQCVYSNEPLVDNAYTAITPGIRETIEAELANLAANDTWPAQAVWQHELIYLAANLPEPVSTSSIAGHSRLPFKRAEAHLKALRLGGTLQLDAALNTWTLPPLRYPRTVYSRHDSYIRQFPGAIKEEFEVRLTKGLALSLIVLLLCLMLAVVARIPFPLVFFGGLICATFVFLKILKSPPQPIPEV